MDIVQWHYYDDNWDWIYDISEPNDGMIDFSDLVILIDNWLVGK